MNTSLIDRSIDRDLKVFRSKPELESLLRVLYFFENTIGTFIQPHDLNERKFYSHISSGYGELATQLDIVEKQGLSDRRFLDVGCGLGTKVFFANQLGWRAAGIEQNRKYVAIAQELNSGYEIFRRNALRFKDYNQYDVIFLYWPMPSRENMAKLLRRIFKRMKPNSCFVRSTLWGHDDLVPKTGFTELHPGVFLKHPADSCV